MCDGFGRERRETEEGDGDMLGRVIGMGDGELRGYGGWMERKRERS